MSPSFTEKAMGSYKPANRKTFDDLICSGENPVDARFEIAKRGKIMENERITEALSTFLGWLTTRDEVTTMSAAHDSAPIAALLKEFVEVNDLPPAPDSPANWIFKQPARANN